MNMDIGSSSCKQETRTNLIINHLPHNLTEPDFHKLFSEIGPIKNYRIMRDLKTGSSFGFGFVDYTSPDDAAKAILQLNNHAIQHKRLKVSYAQPPDGGDEKETNLYIQNLPRVYTVENLDQLFSQYGKIVQKLVFKDKTTGMPRGVGFVRYENKSEAYAAIDALNGQIPEGGTEPLVVKIAKDNSNKKKSAFQAGYQAGLARGAGRGRSQNNTRGGAYGGQQSYSEMGFGGNVRGFGNPTDNFSGAGVGGGGLSGGGGEFSQQGGKMGLDRANNRYNPIGGGGGYAAGTGIGIAYGGGGGGGTLAGGGGGGIRDAAGTQFSRMTTDTYGGGQAGFGSMARPGAGAYAGRY